MWCEMSKEIKRAWWIDIIRIIASLMVVIGHSASEGWYSFRPDTNIWGALNFYDTFGRPSIPLFIMISGYLFLNKKSISYKKLWKNHISHILIIYVVWVVFYALMFPGLKKALSDLQAIRKNLLGINPHYHLWYLRKLLFLYPIIPLLWTLVHHMDEKQVKYYLMLFICFGILRNTVNGVTDPYSWVHRQIGLFGVMDLVEYTGLFMLGYFLPKIKAMDRLSNKVLFLIYMITLFSASALNKIISIHNNEATEALYGEFSLPVVIEAACLFLIAKRSLDGKDFSAKKGGIIKLISESTLFIYLIHPLIIQRVEIYLNFHVTDFDPIFAVPLFALLVFVISMLLGIIVKRIPVLNRFC